MTLNELDELDDAALERAIQTQRQECDGEFTWNTDKPLMIFFMHALKRVCRAVARRETDAILQFALACFTLGIEYQRECERQVGMASDN